MVEKDLQDLHSEVMGLRHQMNSLITTVNELVQALETFHRILQDKEAPKKSTRMKVLKNDLN